MQTLAARLMKAPNLNFSPEKGPCATTCPGSRPSSGNLTTIDLSRCSPALLMFLLCAVVISLQATGVVAGPSSTCATSGEGSAQCGEEQGSQQSQGLHDYDHGNDIFVAALSPKPQT